MSYPVGWDLVNVTGTYIGKNGVPCVGSVTFSSPQLVLRSGTIVPAADIVFNLVNGTFSGQIPATDDPNANPVGWVYTVTENVPGGRQGYQIVAPHASSGIDLSTVVPVTMPMPPTFGFPYVTLSQLAAPGGSSLIGYQNVGTGAVARTVQSRLQETISVKDYGAKGDGVTDDTAAVTAALNYAGANGLTTYFPNGIYLLTSRIGLTAGYSPSMKGQSYGSATLRASGITLNGNGFIDYTSASNFVVEDMVFDFNNSAITVGSEEAIGFINCTDFYFNRNRVLHLVGSGVVTNGCNRFWITNNYIAKDVAANTFNVAINVESASRQSTDGYIIGNQLVNTASDYSCTRCTIAYNRVSNWKFGSGITTEQDTVNSNFYTIVGNICYGSSGTDVNATNPCGIEQWGAYATVANNVCYSNSGDGISQGGQHCTVTGNICFNNGQTGGSGITSRYGTASYNASYSTYTGNRCFDTQGTKTQVYGYQDQSSSLQYISLFANNFDGTNKTAPQNVLAALSSHDGPQIEGSYTINPGAIANGASGNFAETLNGAEVGDMLIASHSTDLQSCVISAYVASANNIVISYYNLSGGSKTISSGTARVRAIKPKDFANY